MRKTTWILGHLLPFASGTLVLRDLAVPRFFGAAINTSFLFADEKYTQLAQTQFSIFTPEIEMKWGEIEPIQNQFNFTGADKLVQLAESVQAKIRGHNFLWETHLPPWINESLSATELDRALKHHIEVIMDRYRGKIYAYDVVNEPISDTPNATFRETIWTHKLGEESVAKALTYARQADPVPKLYINDYDIEGINAKSNSLYEVAKSLKKDGVPLDAIGFQAHITLGQVPSTFRENLQRFVDLDLDVAITELDINMRGPPNATALAQQAEDYHSVVSTCMSIERCVSVTIWGISDDHSWIPDGSVLPWDGNKEPKPAFFAIADAFRGN
ncbi:hypothetical protein VNI00_003579 [Paramarasmius palmivorus]|uniref:Beta-xylanase n=1 Tax=Paramarasmius palmivorus TaxID=297713 RepID=A0AAW0DS55_9AGAR